MKFVARVIWLVIVAGLSAWAQPVAEVQSIQGERGKRMLSINSPTDPPDQWFRAHIEMDAAKGDRFKTNLHTRASLRFLMGARANLDRGSEIRITGERDIEILNRTVLWAKFGTQPSKIQIHTSGGAMAIRGTEFVVEVDEEGHTTLSMLHGKVDVAPKLGESFEAESGAVVRFGPKTPISAAFEEVDALLARLRRDYAGLHDMRALLGDLEQLTQEAGAYQTRVSQASDSVTFSNRVVTHRTTGVDPGDNRATNSGKASDLLSEIESTLNKTKTRGSEYPETRLFELLQPQQYEISIRPGRSQESVPTLDPRPALIWTEARGDKFAVLITPPGMEKLLWMEQTDTKFYQYPEDARPLKPGDYQCYVIPLDSNNQHEGWAYSYPFSVVY